MKVTGNIFQKTSERATRLLKYSGIKKSLKSISNRIFKAGKLEFRFPKLKFSKNDVRPASEREVRAGPGCVSFLQLYL
jgi:hypothetical protein